MSSSAFASGATSASGSSGATGVAAMDATSTATAAAAAAPPALKASLSLNFKKPAAKTASQSLDTRKASEALAASKTDADHEADAEAAQHAERTTAVTSLTDIAKDAQSSGAAPIVIPLIRKNNWAPSSLAEVSGGKATTATASATASASGAGADTPAVKKEVTVTDQALAELLAAAKAKMANSDEELEKRRTEAALKTMKALPLLVQNAVPGLDAFGNRDEKGRFKHDMNLRPNEASLSEYNAVPVEAYGTGMLIGMGWTPGGTVGVGKFARKVEPTEFHARASRQGLGASIAKSTLEEEAKKRGRIPKPGEQPTPSQKAAARSDAEAKAHHFKTFSKRVIPLHSLSLRIGALVEILAGPNKGKYGRVTAISDTSASGKTAAESGGDDRFASAPSSAAGPNGAAAAGSASGSSGSSSGGANGKAASGSDAKDSSVVGGLAKLCTIKLNLTGVVLADPLPSPVLSVLDEHALPRDHPAFDTKETLALKAEREKQVAEEHAKAIRDRAKYVEQKQAEEERSKRGERSRSRSRSRDRERKRDRDRDRDRDGDRERDRSSRSGGSSSKRSARSPSPPSASASSSSSSKSNSKSGSSSSSSSSSRSSSGTSKSSSSSSSSSSTKSSSKSSSAMSDDALKWVVPHIRVRVTSKTLGGGKWYAKTGVVEDVTTRSSFLLVMDDGKTPVEGVRESQVQTALPKQSSSSASLAIADGSSGYGSARVLVVRGVRRGQIGRLMARDKEKGTALIKLDEELEYITADLDDIAEYCYSH